MLTDRELSARRFTASAANVMGQLESRAADRSMLPDETEQAVPMLALWSLLRWERKIGIVALERMGVTVDALALDVDRTLTKVCAEIRRQNGLPQLNSLPSGQRAFVADFLTAVAPLLESAEREAGRLGHDWVGSEHLLLAIIQTADARLHEVLTRHRIGYSEARQAVLALLQSRGTNSA